MDGFRLQSLSDRGRANKLRDGLQVDMRVGAAGGAVGLAADLERLEGHRKRVVDEQASHKWLANVQDHFDGFGGLNQTNHARQYPEHSGIVATGRQFRRRGFRIQATVAWPLVRNEGRDLAIETEDAAI